MHVRKWLLLAALGVVAVLALAACGGGDGDGDATGDTTGQTTGGTGAAKCDTTDKVTLQLKWVTQAQFAGYYAAKEKGYYEQECLDVEIRPGGPDIVPEQVVAGGQAEFGINWLDSLLATRDQGTKIVNIAQVFTRSGMTEVSWKDSGITTIADMRGKKLGVWLGGNEHKLFAALTKNGIDPQKDAEIVAQPFNMDLLVNREVDAAAAMTYNELAQILETENEDTGELYKLEDLNVIKMSDVGTGALEDGVFVREDWISEEKNQDIAKRFIKASIRGWVFCRDTQQECLSIVLDNGPTLGEGHQRWMLNEVNDLIWPAPQGIGVMNGSDFDLTATIAKDYKIIKQPATTEAYTDEFAKAAVQELEDEGVDVNGSGWQKETVEVTKGGE